MINILLILYCWTIVHDMALDCKTTVKNSSSDMFHRDFGLSSLIDLSRSTGTFSAGRQCCEWMKHALEFTFHCILMVLELNLVIHWSNICFVDLFNTQMNFGSVLDMLPIFAVFKHVHTFQLQGYFLLCSLFPWGQSQHYRQQMGIRKMRILVCKEKKQ